MKAKFNILYFVWRLIKLGGLCTVPLFQSGPTRVRPWPCLLSGSRSGPSLPIASHKLVNVTCYYQQTTAIYFSSSDFQRKYSVDFIYFYLMFILFIKFWSYEMKMNLWSLLKDQSTFVHQGVTLTCVTQQMYGWVNTKHRFTSILTICQIVEALSLIAPRKA